MRAYETAFARYQKTTAQVLLSHDDLRDRDRYLNARNTLNRLLELGVIPIINENDTVATEEFRFGDNDTLAALVANLVDADMLLLLTDQEGLFTADPRTHSDAQLIEIGQASDASLDEMAGESGRLGRGGMRSKLKAARLAARSGASTIIANGRRPAVITEVASGAQLGTYLTADKAPITARKQWLAGLQKEGGQLVIDQGAVDVLTQRGRSLLPVGVVEVVGCFDRGDAVLCVAADGRAVARGLVNYSSEELLRTKGLNSQDVAELLGYAADSEAIHRDNMVLL